MPRIARVVVPGLPHHITQRGNRRQKTFFSADDYRLYLSLLRWWAPRSGISIWTYCLMPNHVHIVAVPAAGDSLATFMGEVHRRYTLQINAERGWTGYLWQGRFSSTVMDEAHAVATARYVAMNPVRAGLVARPDEWPYSSARAHLGTVRDSIVDPAGYARLIADWPALLAPESRHDATDLVRLHTRTGRPLGSEAFVSDVEGRTGRVHLGRKKGGQSKEGPHSADAQRMVAVPIQ